MEVLTLDEARLLLEARLPAGARGAHREGRLVDHEGVVVRTKSCGDRVGGRVHPAEVRPRLVVDEEGHDDDHGVRVADGRGGVRRGHEAPAADHFAEVIGQVRFTGEGLLTSVDEIDDCLVDVGAEDLHP